MNKHITTGLVIGLALGVVVSLGATAAIQKDKDTQNTTPISTSTADHNELATAKLRDLKGDAFDKAFIEEMIQHHQGAIDMARLIETNGRHTELKQLGREIITAQSREIGMMRAWQGDWGYQDALAPHEKH